MSASTTASTMEIAWRTRAAEDWLISTKSPRVMHIFDLSCNLVNEYGEAVSLNHPGVPKTPLSLTLADGVEQPPLASWRTWLVEDAEVAVSVPQKWLSVGGKVLDWRRAAKWNAVPDWAFARRGLTTWPESEQSLRALCQTESPPGSLTPLLYLDPSVPGYSRSSSVDAGLHAQLLKKAGPLANRLVAALADGVPNLAVESAGALAGLGTGLTPSGDDFLMGVMHALWTLGDEPDASGRSNWILGAAAPRTSALSRAWLRTAAHGEAGEHWHGLLSALGGKDSQELSRSARDILATGHSSGADALAGFLMAIAAISSSSPR